METGLIKYNLKDRERQYRGQERNYNIKAIVDAINGNECQERVQKGDMLGYYGHWPRLKFGMAPTEGGMDASGKIIMLEILFKSGIGQNMAQIKRRAAEYSIIGQLLFGCYRRQQLTSRIIIQCLQMQLRCPPPENRALASKHFPFHKTHITAA